VSEQKDLLQLTPNEARLLLAALRGFRFSGPAQDIEGGEANRTLRFVTDEAKKRWPEQAGEIEAALFTLQVKLQDLPAGILRDLNRSGISWGIRSCDDDGSMALGYGPPEAGYKRPWEND
jgi:hypothetical protein